MKNIYDKINDIETSYTEEDLTDIERQRIRKLATTYSKKKSKTSKTVGLAAALALAFSMAVPSVRASVGNFASNIRISLIDTIGASKDSDKYVTHLKEAIDIDGHYIKIENLVFDEDKMFIDILTDSDYVDDAPIYSSLSHVKINGEVYKLSGFSGSSYEVDDDNKISLYSVVGNFDKTLPSLDKADIELYFTTSLTSAKVISINSSVNKANEEMKVFAKDLEIPNTNGAIVSNMKANPITMSATLSKLEEGYVYEIEAKDKDGKKIVFDLRSASGDIYNFLLNSTFSEISLDEIKDGREINFQLYRAKMNPNSGKETTDEYEKFGDSFTLKAK